MCKKKGRDPVFRCVYCGRYISYADIETDKIKEHISALFDRVDKIKDKQFQLMEKIAHLNEKIDANSIEDIKQMQKAGGKAGSKSAVKWTAIIMTVIEIIRQLIGVM